MEAFDQRTSLPDRWSLKPEDTLGLIFWTKNPRNLIMHEDTLKPYRVKVHLTVTGWTEVEKGAPDISEACDLMVETAKTFGPENVTWRFSPVPLVEDVEDRFLDIAEGAAKAGLNKVFLAFLQHNDLMPEMRREDDRWFLLHKLATIGKYYGIKIYLCNEDQLLATRPPSHPNLARGVCAPPEDFGQPHLFSEACGCGYAVDPFTINETCTLGCQYCYAADKTLAPKKRNTTKALPVIR